MRTGTEFISEISAATIFTSFNFHIFRFSGKGEADEYRMSMCLRFIVSIPCHAGADPGFFSFAFDSAHVKYAV